MAMSKWELPSNPSEIPISAFYRIWRNKEHFNSCTIDESYPIRNDWSMIPTMGLSLVMSNQGYYQTFLCQTSHLSSLISKLTVSSITKSMPFRSLRVAILSRATIPNYFWISSIYVEWQMVCGCHLWKLCHINNKWRRVPGLLYIMTECPRYGFQILNRMKFRNWNFWKFLKIRTDTLRILLKRC